MHRRRPNGPTVRRTIGPLGRQHGFERAKFPRAAPWAGRTDGPLALTTNWAGRTDGPLALTTNSEFCRPRSSHGESPSITPFPPSKGMNSILCQQTKDTADSGWPVRQESAMSPCLWKSAVSALCSLAAITIGPRQERPEAESWEVFDPGITESGTLQYTVLLLSFFGQPRS